MWFQLLTQLCLPPSLLSKIKSHPPLLKTTQTAS